MRTVWKKEEEEEETSWEPLGPLRGLPGSFLGGLSGLLVGLLGPLGGSLGAPSSLWGPLRAPMSSLTSRATLTPCLVLPPVQLGKFPDF